MQIAERLYTSGFISYPRTESSAYPPGFDFKDTLSMHRNHVVWGEYARALMSAGVQAPKVGPDDAFRVEVRKVHTLDTECVLLLLRGSAS